ncbi:MAG: hypothetical protein J0I08_01215 [Rhizobiales bacterium]|nr:hypothetical protein [Hyphomicrobiales bacterium]
MERYFSDNQNREVLIGFGRHDSSVREIGSDLLKEVIDADGRDDVSGSDSTNRADATDHTRDVLMEPKEHRRTTQPPKPDAKKSALATERQPHDGAATGLVRIVNGCAAGGSWRPHTPNATRGGGECCSEAEKGRIDWPKPWPNHWPGQNREREIGKSL